MPPMPNMSFIPMHLFIIKAVTYDRNIPPEISFTTSLVLSFPTQLGKNMFVYYSTTLPLRSHKVPINTSQAKLFHPKFPILSSTLLTTIFIRFRFINEPIGNCHCNYFGSNFCEKFDAIHNLPQKIYTSIFHPVGLKGYILSHIRKYVFLMQFTKDQIYLLCKYLTTTSS
jgi:hypothetical protein